MSGADEAANLRALIAKAFVATPYEGLVTPADGMEWAEDIDEDLELWQVLRGKSWTEVADEFVDRHHGSLPLLTPRAFAAFLPAWLTRSLLNREVREFTIYEFMPRLSVGIRRDWQDRIDCLSAEQIDCVRQFLFFVREYGDEGSDGDAAAAIEALSGARR